MSSAGYKYRLMLRDLSMLLPYLLCIKLLIEHMEMLHSIYNNIWIAWTIFKGRRNVAEG